MDVYVDVYVDVHVYVHVDDVDVDDVVYVNVYGCGCEC